MLSIPEQKELKIVNNSIVPSLSKSTPIHFKIREWDLSQLVDIVTTDSLESSRDRAKADRLRKSSSGAILGAVVGAGIDSMSGDDSVLDGALIGAALGASAGSVPMQVVTAKVVLLFCDDATLSLEVDAYEYTKLHEILLSNKNNKIIKSSSSVSVRNLNKNEIEEVFASRRYATFLKKIVLCVFIIAIPLISKLFLAMIPPDNQHSEFLISFINEKSHYLDFFAPFIGFILIVAAINWYTKGKDDPEVFDDEIQFLKSNNGEDGN